jgi:thiamine transport system permease protein
VSFVVVLVLAPLVAMSLRSMYVDGRVTTSGWSNLVGSPGPLMSNIDMPSVIIRSAGFALIAAAIAVPIGIAAAIGLARRSGPLVRAILNIPVATSAVVVGFGILITYDTTPFDIRSAWWLIPMIHAVVALPFVVRTALPVVQSIPQGLRDAAAVLGATPLRRWWTIDAPLLHPAFATGLGLSMALSLGEFGATSFLTRRDSQTLPIVIDQLLGRAGETAFTTAMAASTGLMLLTALIVVTFDSSLRT